VVGPAAVVTELTAGNGAADYPNSVSFDSLKIVFQSNRNGGLMQLFSATRPNLASPFSGISQGEFGFVNEPAFNISAGIISANRLELFYQRGSNVYRASRVDSFAPFSGPAPVTSVEVGTGIHSPQFLSQDGLRLYTFNTTGVGSPTTGLYVAQRPDLLSAFGSSTNAPFVNTGYSEEMYLSPDELELYYVSNSGNILWSWRPDLATPFTAGVQIQADGGAPVLGGNKLFFGRSSGIWASSIPEPTADVLMGMAAAAAGTLRPARRKNK
jgi:hypothetical protein